MIITSSVQSLKNVQCQGAFECGFTQADGLISTFWSQSIRKRKDLVCLSGCWTPPKNSDTNWYWIMWLVDGGANGFLCWETRHRVSFNPGNSSSLQILGSSCAFWKVPKKNKKNPSIFNSTKTTAKHSKKQFLQLNFLPFAAVWTCQQGMLPVSSFRKCGALPGSKLSVIRHQTNSLHPPPPQGPNRAALPPLFVLCLIRTEEMCGHETFERIAVKGQRRLPTSYFNRSRPDRF